MKLTSIEKWEISRLNIRNKIGYKWHVTSDSSVVLCEGCFVQKDSFGHKCGTMWRPLCEEGSFDYKGGTMCRPLGIRYYSDVFNGKWLGVIEYDYVMNKCMYVCVNLWAMCSICDRTLVRLIWSKCYNESYYKENMKEWNLVIKQFWTAAVVWLWKITKYGGNQIRGWIRY